MIASNLGDGVPRRVAGHDVVTRPIDVPGSSPAPPVLGARHQLLVWLGETIQPWALPERGTIVIGRASDSDIRIESAAVSRHHAQLLVQPDSIRVADLGSQNGTRVNGERLTGTRLLAYGDILSFGDVTSVLRERCSPAPELATAGTPATKDAAAPDQMLELGDRTVLVADPAMAHVYTQLARLAPTNLSVLILGETGAGKELAASALRIWSKRAKQPMVSINCAALPADLAESELFGYERGAFSGAAGTKLGLLEAANGGTILLDEIGDLPLPVQAKLLRAIENRCLTRLGSVREQAIDVRVIAATHRDLEAGVRAGWFRADLYYRLGVAVVRIPPLRARRRELPLLARRFVDDACRTLGRAPLALGDDAIAGLLAHDWPGNVRELKNLIDCVAVAATAAVITADLVAEHLLGGRGFMTDRDAHGRAMEPSQSSSQAQAPSQSSSQSSPSFSSSWSGLAQPPRDAEPRAVRETVAATTGPVRHLAQASMEFERKTIEAALAETSGNKTRAAKRLGVPLRTFMDKIKRYGL